MPPQLRMERVEERRYTFGTLAETIKNNPINNFILIDHGFFLL